MNRLFCFSIVLFTFTACQQGFQQPSDTDLDSRTDSLLTELMDLEGVWKGNYRWSGAKEGSGNISVRYAPIGNMAISENHIYDNDQIAMSSVYHLDGSDLKMTHYCWLNQPELILDQCDLENKSIYFKTTKVGNFDRSSGHVTQINLWRLETDSLHIVFTFEEEDATSVERIELRRTGYGNRGAKRFSENINSSGHAYGISFTNDMQKAYYTFKQLGADKSFIYTSDYSNGAWSDPVITNFSGQYEEFDPNISPDNTVMFIMTSRPEAGHIPNDNFDIWYLRNEHGEWVDPKPLNAEVNTDRTEGVVGISSNNQMYFFSSREGGFGSSDVYEAEFNEGEPTNVKNLGDLINTEYWDGHPTVSPDGKLLIYYSNKPWDTYGNGDLYASINIDGAWSKPKNLGPKVNSAECEITPSFSPDMKLLFFGRVHTTESSKIGVANRSIWYVPLDELGLDYSVSQ